MRRRPLNLRRLLAGFITAASLLAAVWLALYAAREDREPRRVIGRVREPKVNVSELEPLMVQTDPATGEVVVIARDSRGNLAQLRVPAPSSTTQPYPGYPTLPPPGMASSSSGVSESVPERPPQVP